MKVKHPHKMKKKLLFAFTSHELEAKTVRIETNVFNRITILSTSEIRKEGFAGKLVFQTGSR